jgi:hypothetical protein
LPVWRAMWEAARDYSRQPYPDKAFPVTDEARCVLCHQDLSAEAQQRLNNLEAFVQSRLEIDAATAERRYAQAIGELAPSLYGRNCYPLYRRCDSGKNGINT